MSSEVARQIEAKKKEIAHLEEQVHRANLVESIVKNPKIDDEKLYGFAKSYCNRVEKTRRAGKKGKKDE